MNTTIRNALAIALTITLTGCLDPTEPRDPAHDPGGTVVGSGNIVTVNRPVSDYSAIKLGGVGRLIITQTGAESLTITADDNIVPLVSSGVATGWLEIAEPANTRLEPSQIIVYRITVKDLDAVAISGVVNASADGILTTTFVADLDGVSTLTVTGSATQQRLTLDGVSTYLAEGLTSESVHVLGSGVMTAAVQVSNLLDGDVCGAGSISYVGSPTVALRACPGVVVGPKVGGMLVGQ